MSIIAILVIIGVLAILPLTIWWSWVLFTTVLAVRRAARRYLDTHPQPPQLAPGQGQATPMPPRMNR